MRRREADLRSHYDKLGYYSPLDHMPFTDICRLVDVEPESVVLDVGCGDGRLAAANPQLEVEGVDYNPVRAQAAGAVCADLYEHLPIGVWATVALIEVLEHLETPHEAVDLARHAATHAVIATVPLDMPYVAHLQDWATVDAVVSDLNPDRYGVFGRHAALYWSPL